MTANKKKSESLSIGTKYFVKYSVLYFLIPNPLIVAVFIQGGAFAILAGILLVLFIYPAIVRIRLPYFYVEAGELYRVSFWGVAKKLGQVREIDISYCESNVALIDPSGNVMTIERSDFWASDWGSVRAFFDELECSA